MLTTVGYQSHIEPTMQIVPSPHVIVGVCCEYFRKAYKPFRFLNPPDHFTVNAFMCWCMLVLLWQINEYMNTLLMINARNPEVHLSNINGKLYAVKLESQPISQKRTITLMKCIDDKLQGPGPFKMQLDFLVGLWDNPFICYMWAPYEIYASKHMDTNSTSS